MLDSVAGFDGMPHKIEHESGLLHELLFFYASEQLLRSAQDPVFLVQEGDQPENYH